MTFEFSVEKQVSIKCARTICWSAAVLSWMIVKCGLHIWEPNAVEEISKLHNKARYKNFI
jgi:hypothetical protein